MCRIWVAPMATMWSIGGFCPPPQVICCQGTCITEQLVHGHEACDDQPLARGTNGGHHQDFWSLMFVRGRSSSAGTPSPQKLLTTKAAQATTWLLSLARHGVSVKMACGQSITTTGIFCHCLHLSQCHQHHAPQPAPSPCYRTGWKWSYSTAHLGQVQAGSQCHTCKLLISHAFLGHKQLGHKLRGLIHLGQ